MRVEYGSIQALRDFAQPRSWCEAPVSDRPVF
jgi:hypothetical protein